MKTHNIHSKTSWKWWASLALMSLTLALAGGCGDDDNNGGGSDGSTDTPTDTPPPTVPPGPWERLKIEVEDEATPTPGSPCLAREFEVDKNGAWRAHDCGVSATSDDDEEERTGTVTKKELETLNNRVNPVIEDIGERSCEAAVSISDVDVDLFRNSSSTGDDDDGDSSGSGNGGDDDSGGNGDNEQRIRVVDSDPDDGRICYQGGVADAQALRDYLLQLRQKYGASTTPTPTPGTGDDNPGGDDDGTPDEGPGDNPTT